MGTETNGGNFKREGRLMIVTTNVTSGCLRRLDLIHKRVESHKIRLHPDLLLGSLPTDQPVFLTPTPPRLQSSSSIYHYSRSRI